MPREKFEVSRVVVLFFFNQFFFLLLETGSRGRVRRSKTVTADDRKIFTHHRTQPEAGIEGTSQSTADDEGRGEHPFALGRRIMFWKRNKKKKEQAEIYLFFTIPASVHTRGPYSHGEGERTKRAEYWAHIRNRWKHLQAHVIADGLNIRCCLISVYPFRPISTWLFSSHSASVSILECANHLFSYSWAIHSSSSSSLLHIGACYFSPTELKRMRERKEQMLSLHLNHKRSIELKRTEDASGNVCAGRKRNLLAIVDLSSSP